ncbi:GNAT family N-acetyltransferase [Pseudooctadecabacter sp.]|uniref:GNAT family N-acetyltransferase n=1 Tax=Pseudooctadecabacter sp. TaxID=1966338 RepID=UPI0035C7A197
MRLRPATRADAPAIRQIARAAYTQYIAAIGRDPAPMVADFEDQIADGTVHVAEVDGHAIGFIVFFEQQDTMMLENVAVDPAAVGVGIGGALIDLCEDAARAAGKPSVTLYTNVAMTENQTLYPHLGYKETHRQTDGAFQRVYYKKSLKRSDR